MNKGSDDAKYIV